MNETHDFKLYTSMQPCAFDEQRDPKKNRKAGSGCLQPDACMFGGYGSLCRSCESQRRITANAGRLTAKQQRLLDFIRDHPNALQKQMASVMGMHEVSVSGMLRIIERKGFIKRVARWQVMS